MWNLKGPSNEADWPQDKTPTKGEKEDSVNKFSPEFSRARSEGQTAILGTSIHIKGELTGNEDLTIDGKVEGKIELKQHHLTIGPGGNITADIHAKRITIQGEVRGNVTAQDVVEIQTGGKLRGDIITPRITISDGAFFKGNVEMEDTRSTSKQPIPGKEKIQPLAETVLAKP